VELSGEQTLAAIAALANPHRVRVLAVLEGGRNYVSQIAREVGLSRPLVHMHLQKLEAAGLIHGELELSEDGKAMKYFEVAPFSIRLTPRSIAAIAASLTTEEGSE
jgi:predicted transcriptional regulator